MHTYTKIKINMILLLNPVSLDTIELLPGKLVVIVLSDYCQWCCQSLDLMT